MFTFHFKLLSFYDEPQLLFPEMSKLPVVAGMPHVCCTLAAAGRVHKVIHNDPHDWSRPFKLPVEQNRNMFTFKNI